MWERAMPVNRAHGALPQNHRTPTACRVGHASPPHHTLNTNTGALPLALLHKLQLGQPRIERIAGDQFGMFA